MTPKEERLFWNVYRNLRCYRTGERKGQALFNALFTVAPILADMIRGTLSDPFYDDDRIPAFCKELGILEP